MQFNTVGETREWVKYVITLHGVKYVPELGPYNHFSLPTAMKKGYLLGSCDKTITSFKVAFDTAILTKSSCLAAVEMIPIVGNQERIPSARGEFQT